MQKKHKIVTWCVKNIGNLMHIIYSVHRMCKIPTIDLLILYFIAVLKRKFLWNDFTNPRCNANYKCVHFTFKIVYTPYFMHLVRLNTILKVVCTMCARFMVYRFRIQKGTHKTTVHFCLCLCTLCRTN